MSIQQSKSPFQPIVSPSETTQSTEITPTSSSPLNKVHYPKPLRPIQQIKIKNTKKCTCNKTKCLKKYCECFANNLYCEDCDCKGCLNRPMFYGLKDEINDNEETICTCVKSNCNKKYCECVKKGRKCGKLCRCLNCFNKKTNENKFEIYRVSVSVNDGAIQINEEKFLSKKTIYYK